jgi:GntR family transcriptional regulator
MPGLAEVAMSLRRSARPNVVKVTDDWEPDPGELTHVYVQVADHIAELISSGALAPGAKLPAERDIARQYGVAYETVRRATELLRERGLIVTMIGRGTYVAKPGKRKN